MLINRASLHSTHWELVGPWGEALVLPRAFSGPFQIGLFGTRSLGAVKGRKTEHFAECLAALDRPIYLIDTRRNGTGSQSSWSPLEFASVIPRMMCEHAIKNGKTAQPYGFLHMPSMAPSLELLDRYQKATEPERKVQKLQMKLNELRKDQDPTRFQRLLEIAKAKWEQHNATFSVDLIETVADEITRKDRIPDNLELAAYQHWEIFKAIYDLELSEVAIDAACAFVEAAQVQRGLAIFMCAERSCAEFTSLGRDGQNDEYCHRYTLATAIGIRLQKRFPGTTVERIEILPHGSCYTFLQ